MGIACSALVACRAPVPSAADDAQAVAVAARQRACVVEAGADASRASVDACRCAARAGTIDPCDGGVP